MIFKLEILLTGAEVLGSGVKDDGLFLQVQTDCSRKRIPLYEFKCTRSLTHLLAYSLGW